MAAVIAISGFSGAGKSLQGKRLANELGYQYLDLDKYFIPSREKPRIQLSDGSTTVNFDSLKALDLKRFKKDVRRLSATGNLIVTGFTLRKEVLPFQPDHHLHLMVDKKIAIDRRFQAKPFIKKDPRKKKRETMMINEVAYPFYLETLSHSEIDKYFDANLPASEVYQQIKKYLGLSR